MLKRYLRGVLVESAFLYEIIILSLLVKGKFHFKNGEKSYIIFMNIKIFYSHIHKEEVCLDMSRGFSEYEKQVITDALIEQGRVLFSKFGFQKTSISEITKNVGIAQGTFYKFFNSKEELYFVILEMEEIKIKEQLANVDILKDNRPKLAIKSILRDMIQSIETNPLLSELFFGNNLEDMLKKLSPEILEKRVKNDSNSLLPVLEKLKSEGYIVAENPEVVAGVMRSLFLLTLHRKEIGIQVYQETMELLIDLIVDGLIKEEEK